LGEYTDEISMDHDEKHGKMLAVPILDFISGSQLPVDIYVKLSDQKFVKVAHSGEAVQLDRLSNYQNKRVDFLYIRKDDYPKYVHQEIMVAEVLVKRDNLGTGTKTNVLRNAAESVFQEIENFGFNEDTYDHARKIANATLTMVNSQTDLNDLLKQLQTRNDFLYTHSVAVGAISAMIGQAMGWIKQGTLEKLSLGGFLHDIGKKELPPELSKKPRAKLSFEELLLYESHPFRGMEILKSIGIVPDDVVSIVYEHHENNIGQGFPRRLRSFRIHPLARVVSLANTFAALTLKHPNYLKPKPPLEALHYIESVMGTPFDKDAFKALKYLFMEEDIEIAG
jgi:putative nucleotidyltransferase with HDIG domain